MRIPGGGAYSSTHSVSLQFHLEVRKPLRTRGARRGVRGLARGVLMSSGMTATLFDLLASPAAFDNAVRQAVECAETDPCPGLWLPSGWEPTFRDAEAEFRTMSVREARAVGLAEADGRARVLGTPVRATPYSPDGTSGPQCAWCDGVGMFYSMGYTFCRYHVATRPGAVRLRSGRGES